MYFCNRLMVKLMFFKRFKKKSAQKCIVNQTKVPRALNTNKIKTVGVLVDAEQYSLFPYAKKIASLFSVSEEDVHVLYYHPDKKQKETFEGELFTDADLSFKATLKSDMANQFIQTPFDCLINFYKDDKLMLNLVAVKSKAQFKIGFASINENINDFSVATTPNHIDVFVSELKKYLTILNKI